MSDLKNILIVFIIICPALLFGQSTKLYNGGIEMNFKELPNIDTMSGCLLFNDNAKDVVKRMINEYN